MKTVRNGMEIERELTRVYDRLNQRFFGGELPTVMITIAPKRGSSGHLTSRAVWVERGGQRLYELNLSAYSLDRDRTEIAATLLHEMCHLYNAIHEVRDTSRGGYYHNERFKECAEAHGLIVKRQRHDNNGWWLTELGPEAKRFVTTEIHMKDFAIRREDAKSNHNLKRMVCPSCGIRAYVSSLQPLVCGKCGVPLVPDQGQSGGDR